MTKWYQKASVQTALTTGVILIVISLSGALFSLYKEKAQFKSQIELEIEEGIDQFIVELMLAKKLTREIDLSPNLMTLEETSGTLSRLNSEISITSNTISIVNIYRLVKKYGRDTTLDTFGTLVNSNADAHIELIDFVLSVSRRHGRFKRLDNLDYVNEIYHKYVELINSRGQSRSELYTYIVNLVIDDFDV